MTDSGRRILVVEDNPATLMAIQFSLEMVGLEVTTAPCAEAAWDLLTRRDYDLVLTDFQMPGMSGSDLCERMGKDPRLARIPVILLTGKSFELDVVHHLDVFSHLGEVSVREILPKPFSPRELAEKVLDRLRAEAASE
jgi:CheY-like chemotaxis protein